jgi:hypothetical protein
MLAAFAFIPLLGAARSIQRPGAATAVALTYTLFRRLVLLIIWAMGSTAHLTPPAFALAPALVLDLALCWTRQCGMLIVALLTAPALLIGEWGYRVIFGAPAWVPLEVITSLAVITGAVALGGLAGGRLAALLRGE